MVRLNDSIAEQREGRVMDVGRRYWRKMEGETPGLFDRHFWYGQIIDWVIQDEDFKTDALRFVDVLPMLDTTSAMASHVRDYLLRDERSLPLTLRSALKMAAGGITAPLAAKAVRRNVTEMARRFICENEPDKIRQATAELEEEGCTFTLDILGEATASDAESEHRLRQYGKLIELLGERSGTGVGKDDGREARGAKGQPAANISLKISAFDAYLDAADHRGSVSRLQEKLLPLLKKARDLNVFVNFDLEQWALHDITYGLFEEIACHPDLRDWPHLGIVLQAYLRSSEEDYQRLLALGRTRQTPFTVRLVKGAYWDYELVHARQHGLPVPVLRGKGLVDARYEQLSGQLLDQHRFLTPAFASHNLRSLVHAVVTAREKGVDKSAFELQMLYGMAEPLRRAFAGDGYLVRVYLPVGDLLPGMAYLVRRLLENTSGSGFLRRSYVEGAEISTLLSPPVLEAEPEEEKTMVPGDPGSPFANTGLLDFCDQRLRDNFSRAVLQVRDRFPLDIPVVAGGREAMRGDLHIRVSPGEPSLEIARVSRAAEADADLAIEEACNAFPAWRDEPLRRRAELLDAAASRLEGNRCELAALQVHEQGKPWREADADVAEAIDFCRYYARQALRELGPARQESPPGERNVLLREGRGPTAVIAPWNFPLAILCGMTSAALVAGNPVLIKPATASSAIAYLFYRHLMAAGFPQQVVHFLPGAGGEIGAYLAEHPQIAQIAFTGSREVGLAILEQAGKTSPGQPEIKKVVCEMGGKNAIIVDEDADPDAAISGIMQSAFGYAGQKCSACSRLILVGPVYDFLLPRLVDACRSLPIRPAADPACRLGPVIDRRAMERLNKLIADPPPGAEKLFQGAVPADGFFVPPVIFTVSDPQHPLMQQELFGPLLTVIRAGDFREALDIAGRTEFALTGGVYSRSPGNIALAKEGFKVGNLYINRGCTGARVGRQPFGGHAMSGTGTKAGGPGYLLNFTNPRCLTENTMRSGFTPELQI